MDKKNVMVSDQLYDETEREIEALLESITRECDSSEERIDSIMKRIKVEAVLKESADFATESMGKGLKGITDALTGLVKKDKKPPKRSY